MKPGSMNMVQHVVLKHSGMNFDKKFGTGKFKMLTKIRDKICVLK